MTTTTDRTDPQLSTAGGSAAPRRPRRKHPSQGARVVALVSSLAATVGVGGAMAVADHAPASTVAAASGAATASATSSGAAAPAVTATGSSATAAAASPSAAATKYANGTFTGASEYTRWGNYQVSVTVKNGKITSIRETQAPSDPKSEAINGRAQPVLEAEAIAAQSANIDAVSGATYTSKTYKASLQSALDQAAKLAVASA